jgi:hypothetical protein
MIAVPQLLFDKPVYIVFDFFVVCRRMHVRFVFRRIMGYGPCHQFCNFSESYPRPSLPNVVRLLAAYFQQRCAPRPVTGLLV